MSFSDKLSTGWTLAKSSFRVLQEKKELIIFPILSSISIILVIGSFVAALIGSGDWDRDTFAEDGHGRIGYYLIGFAFYVVNYFIIVFFNMALVHCTRLYFRGEAFTLRDGLQFSMSRIGTIFSWAVFAATIGLLLRSLQENLGLIGKIVTGILGIVWSVATFFVVPIIAYEQVGPIDAVKRSSSLMKDKWGESLGANFSFGVINFVGMLLVGGILFAIGYMIHPIAGMALAAIGLFMVFVIMSAAETIFVSAVYHQINGDVVKHMDQQLVDDLFTAKRD